MQTFTLLKAVNMPGYSIISEKTLQLFERLAALFVHIFTY